MILVVHEIFGVHEHIKDVCRRFAKEGYYAIAPELFARQGDVSKMTDFKEILGKVVSKVPDAQVMSDLDAAVAFAKKRSTRGYFEAVHYRFLLGGSHCLAVCRPAKVAQSRGRLVRQDRRRKG